MTKLVNRCKGSMARNNSPSLLPPFTIRAQRQAMMKRTSASSTHLTLSSMNSLQKSKIIMGANINSNIGTLDDLHSAKFCSALGPHGISKRNKKGKNLLQFFLPIVRAS